MMRNEAHFNRIRRYAMTAKQVCRLDEICRLFSKQLEAVATDIGKDAMSFELDKMKHERNGDFFSLVATGKNPALR